MESCPRGCETLLLAEDEAAVRQSTREFLTLNGYIVLEATNGAEALALARRTTALSI
jgi:CheY-like chemotaxis protein